LFSQVVTPLITLLPPVTRMVPFASAVAVWPVRPKFMSATRVHRWMAGS